MPSGRLCHAMNLCKSLLLVIVATGHASIASAADVDEAVTAVARSHQTSQVTLNGRAAQVVYVEQVGGCEAVSVRSPNDHDQHFRVCGEQVMSRQTVAPIWPDRPANKRVLAAVVQNAVLYGQARQTDEDGYLIQAQTLGAVAASCTHIEVIISFDADLVDYAIKKMCG